MNEYEQQDFYKQTEVRRMASQVDAQRTIVNELKKELRYVRGRKKHKFLLKATELITQLVDEENLLDVYCKAEQQHKLQVQQQHESIRYFAINPYTGQPVGPFDTFTEALDERGRLTHGLLPYQD